MYHPYKERDQKQNNIINQTPKDKFSNIDKNQKIFERNFNYVNNRNIFYNDRIGGESTTQERKSFMQNQKLQKFKKNSYSNINFNVAATNNRNTNNLVVPREQFFIKTEELKNAEILKKKGISSYSFNDYMTTYKKIEGATNK